MVPYLAPQPERFSCSTWGVSPDGIGVVGALGAQRRNRTSVSALRGRRTTTVRSEHELVLAAGIEPASSGYKADSLPLTEASVIGARCGSRTRACWVETSRATVEYQTRVMVPTRGIGPRLPPYQGGVMPFYYAGECQAASTSRLRKSCRTALLADRLRRRRVGRDSLL